MTTSAFDAEAHVRHMEAMLGLDIRPDWRAGVVANVATAAAMAALVMEFPLADDMEPAGVFEAGR